MARSADEYPGVPRWLKVGAIVVAVVVVLVVAVLTLGGHRPPGGHG